MNPSARETGVRETPVVEKFRLGVNYWPARTAMGWWQAFDRTEVATDFARIAGCGFDSVRLFLTWEDFQPTPSRVDATLIEHLATAMDEAERAGLSVMPTLFTGHMSGVNWVPKWALGGDSGDARFRVVSAGKIEGWRLSSWYSDRTIIRAQVKLASELASALAGHAALWSWDLGNENSNCGAAPSKLLARDWLRSMTDAIRGADPGAQITIGLHMEDLEQDRNLGPREAAEVCDFLTMHGYPGYASWAAGPTDERLLPFLAHLTRWLGGETDVLFSEFGVPTFPGAGPELGSAAGPALVSEEEAAAYVARALEALQDVGNLGAMLWCYSDYVRELWTEPPLDLARHERSFGLWRADGEPKPAVSAVTAFANQRRPITHPDFGDRRRWLDLDSDEFYRAPATHLPRLYRRYCDAVRPEVSER